MSNRVKRNWDEKPAFAVPVSGVFPPTFSENSGGFQVEYFGNDIFGKNQDSTQPFSIMILVLFGNSVFCQSRIETNRYF